jgi:hypothetical protein
MAGIAQIQIHPYVAMSRPRDNIREPSGSAGDINNPAVGSQSREDELRRLSLKVIHPASAR